MTADGQAPRRPRTRRPLAGLPTGSGSGLMRLLDSLLKRIVVLGRLTVIWPDGSRSTYTGRAPGPEVRIRVHDRAAATRIALNPGLRFGEAWMDGAITVEEPSVR